MADRNLALTLGKVIIAAAWADGKITPDEINSLKDLLFRLPHGRDTKGMHLTANEWALLEMYMQTPVGVAERSRLLEDLQAALRRPEDKELAIAAIEELIRADGVVTDTERAVANEIKAAINAVDLNIFAQLGRLIAGPIQRRSQAVERAPNREQYFDDFVKNRVYYKVRQRLHMDDAELHIPDADVRKLSLAGGLMARVAHIDHAVNDDECDRMIQILQADWNISREAAALVAEVAVSEAGADLDFYRLTREFTTSTSAEERARFLDVLFDVATADGYLSNAEHEEIRLIAMSLNLSHDQFIAAKVRIPREQRAT